MKPWIYEAEPDWGVRPTQVQEAYRDLSFHKLYDIVQDRKKRLDMQDVYFTLHQAEYLPEKPCSLLNLYSGDKFALTKIAEEQLRAIVGINDNKWFDIIPNRLKDININWGIQNLDKKKRKSQKTFRLVHDTMCRAILSKRYKFFDDVDILDQLKNFIKIQPKSYVSYASFCQESSHFRIILNKKHAMKVGDEVALGIHIRNSEVGRGSISLKAIVYRLVCANGMTLPKDIVKQVHMTHLEKYKNIIHVINKFINDIGESWKKTARTMEKSLNEKINNMEIILDYIKDRHYLLVKDIEEIRKGIREEKPSDTRFALVNGISRYATTLHGDNRIETENIASRILHTPFDEFNRQVAQWEEKKIERAFRWQ